MNRAIQKFVMCIGISLVAMIAIHAAGSNEAARTSKHSITPESVECQALATTQDDAENALLRQVW